MSERYDEREDQERNREEQQYTNPNQYGNQNAPSSGEQGFGQAGNEDVAGRYGRRSTDTGRSDQYGNQGPESDQYGNQGQWTEPDSDQELSGQRSNPTNDPTRQRSDPSDRQRQRQRTSQDDDPSLSGQYSDQGQNPNPYDDTSQDQSNRQDF
jgi:hypothetical protein